MSSAYERWKNEQLLAMSSFPRKIQQQFLLFSSWVRRSTHLRWNTLDPLRRNLASRREIPRDRPESSIIPRSGAGNHSIVTTRVSFSLPPPRLYSLPRCIEIQKFARRHFHIPNRPLGQYLRHFCYPPLIPTPRSPSITPLLSPSLSLSLADLFSHGVVGLARWRAGSLWFRRRINRAVGHFEESTDSSWYWKLDDHLHGGQTGDANGEAFPVSNSHKSPFPPTYTHTIARTTLNCECVTCFARLPQWNNHTETNNATGGRVRHVYSLRERVIRSHRTRRRERPVFCHPFCRPVIPLKLIETFVLICTRPRQCAILIHHVAAVRRDV